MPDGPPSRADMLVRFLADADAPCPACGYNLRGLAGSACPECGTMLRLAVRDGTSPARLPPWTERASHPAAVLLVLCVGLLPAAGPAAAAIP